VDIVIENRRGFVGGVEVKASATVTGSADLNALAVMRRSPHAIDGLSRLRSRSIRQTIKGCLSWGGSFSLVPSGCFLAQSGLLSRRVGGNTGA